MESPTSWTTPRSNSSAASSVTDVLAQERQVSLQIDGSQGEVGARGYSILIRGEVQPSSILSTRNSDKTLTLLENNATLLFGSVTGNTAGFVFDGEIVAAEFDSPAPTVKLDGSVVDPDRWPTVKEYVGHGPDRESVEDPFPDSGKLGASPGDPLDPDEHRIELEAGALDTPEAYCLDIDGDVLSRSDSVTVSDRGDRVYGCLRSNSSAHVSIRGMITRIDTADGVDFSVSAREEPDGAGSVGSP